MTVDSSSVERLAVRILADDLSGALDAAGPFASRDGAMCVYWDVGRAGTHAGDRVALDAASREVDVGDAIARTRAGTRALWTGRHGLAFLKIDSVWRGSPAASIATAGIEGRFDRVVVAPAFPEQGRVTRDGGQWVVDGTQRSCAAADIAAELRRYGLDAAMEASASPSTGAVVCDASSSDDLAAIVKRHWLTGVRTLWCGTRGLARALADHAAGVGRAMATIAHEPTALRGPVLVVVGTDHPVSVAQAGALERQPGIACRTLDSRTARAVASPPEREAAPAVLLRFAIPANSTREAARRTIAQAMRDEADRLSRPGMVVATGGETVRALSEALGATRLDVLAEYEPGIPIAIWRDGRWAGTPILSKSGGFGSQDLFARVVASATDGSGFTRNSR
jgi:D-threonate/D-erythronate kinase